MTLVVPDEVTVDLSAMTLDQLAEHANSEHGSAVDELVVARSHLTAGVLHGIRAGEALLVVRLRFGPRGSGWKDWCDENLGFHIRTATEYIRMARRKQEILAANQHLNGDSVSAFMDSLGPLPRLTRMPNERREQALDLLAGGLTQIEVAAEIGVHRETIRVWSQPDYAERQKERNYRHARNRRRKEKAARLALAEKQRREEAARLAKERGGSLGKTYDQVRRLMPIIDAAISEGLTVEARALAVRLEDEIYKALKG